MRQENIELRRQLKGLNQNLTELIELMKDHNLKKKQSSQPQQLRSPEELVMGKTRELENQDQMTRNLHQEMERL